MTSILISCLSYFFFEFQFETQLVEMVIIWNVNLYNVFAVDKRFHICHIIFHAFIQPCHFGY